MPVGMFRSEEGWVQFDYGTGNITVEPAGVRRTLRLPVARSVNDPGPDTNALPGTVGTPQLTRTSSDKIGA
jgi:hypothetical protein